jgi:hypothetical protein
MMAKKIGFGFDWSIHAEGCGDLKKVDEEFRAGNATEVAFEEIGTFETISELVEAIKGTRAGEIVADNYEDTSAIREGLAHYMKPCAQLH